MFCPVVCVLRRTVPYHVPLSTGQQSLQFRPAILGLSHVDVLQVLRDRSQWTVLWLSNILILQNFDQFLRVQSILPNNASAAQGLFLVPHWRFWGPYYGQVERIVGFLHFLWSVVEHVGLRKLYGIPVCTSGKYSWGKLAQKAMLRIPDYLRPSWRLHLQIWVCNARPWL